MKKLVLAIGYSMGCLLTYAQNITGAEYFFNSDPGAGNAIAISVAPSTQVSFTSVISVSNLPQGFNNLALRTRNQNNIWGLAEIRGFYITSLHSDAEEISEAEYFIDSDPGAGNAIPLSISTGHTIQFNVMIPTNTLSQGFHFLVIRTKDLSGKWGLFESRGFYISTSTSDVDSISQIEYFFDSDPGIGNGSAINMGQGNNMPLLISIPAGSFSGFHFLAIRAKDVSGKWGLIENRGFYITGEASDLADIIAAEFFYNADPGAGNGIPILIPSSLSIYTDSLVLPLGNLPLGTHRIGIRVKNADGIWSLIEDRKFIICTRYGPISKTAYHIENNQVFFTNLSTDNDSTLWKFGDATIDTVLNPIKTYNSAGNYNLELISKNICSNDTLRDIIKISGIHSINASKGGNDGVATVIFEGNGFSAGTSLKLISGSNIILPKDKLFISSKRVIGYFDLTGKSTGSYNVVADLGGGPLDTIKNGFMVNSKVEPSIAIVTGGRNPARTGLMTRTMRLQNRGNEDAIMVPFATVIGHRPGTLSIASMESFVDLTNKGIFQNTLDYISANNISTEVLNPVDIDTSRKKQLLAYYRLKIPSESFVTNYYRIFNPYGLLSYENSSLVHPPVFRSGLVLDDITSVSARDCMNSFLKKAIRKNITVSISDSEWNNCYNNAFDTLARSVRDIVKDITQQDKSIPMKSVFATLLVQMSQCSTGGMPGTITSDQFNKIIKDVTYNWLYLENIDSIGRPCIDTTETIVFRERSADQKNPDKINDTERNDDCPGADLFPELYELCQPFLDACGKVDELGSADEKIFVLFGKKIFEKILEPFDKACKVNSASAFCEKLCEQTSVDPNVKLGPGNNNDLRHVNYLHNYGYTIFFENLATATAPAAYVRITDTLDKTKFDISSFQLNSFSWGDSVVFTDANRGDFSILKDIQPNMPNKLRIDVRTDTLTGIVSWEFFTLDPVTLQLTDDPAEGFLPPNTDGIKGLGSVTFSIKAKADAGITSGTIMNNSASIVFDNNLPIVTPIWQHIVDTTRPASHVTGLPGVVNSTDFIVQWSGNDAHAGVTQYAVYVSVNDSIYKEWKKFTTATADTFHGTFNKTYKFFSVAVDHAGNFEDAPPDPYAEPDAVTTPLMAVPVSLLNFSATKSSDNIKTDLAWQTTSEVNVSHFEIQRSADGINYSYMARIPATNIPNGSNYFRQDVSPLPKINYYRLKIIDQDGSFKLSPVRIVRFTDKDEVLVYPTITSSHVYVQTESYVNAVLLNVNGSVLEDKLIITTGSFDLSRYPAGVYFIKTGNVSHKIIKK